MNDDEDFSRACIEFLDHLHDLMEKFDYSPRVIFTGMSMLVATMILEEDDKEISLEAFNGILNDLMTEDSEN
jgi:hypothetical protein